MKCIGVIGLILISSSAFAQNPTIHASRIPISEFNEPLYDSDCTVPIAPGAGAPKQVITVKPGDKLEFCVDADGSKASTFQYSTKVDDSTVESVMAGCTKQSAPVACVFLIPSDLITALQGKSDHIITMMYHDPLTNMDGPPTSLSVRRPVCIEAGVTYEVGTPLPAVVTGALRNQIGMFTFETQIGKLRDEGWTIEWQRTQFGLDASGLNGYNYMLGWCVGK